MTRALSRSRAAEVDAIVAGIVDAMVSGSWVAGRSHAELAKQHGVSVERVRDWATEAGRTLRVLARTDADDLRARNQARFDKLYDMAINKVAVIQRGDGDTELVPQPDVKAAVSALAEQAKLLGLNAPEKHQHAHVVASYDQLPPGDRLAQVRDAIASLQAEEQRLLAECNAIAPATVVQERGGERP